METLRSDIKAIDNKVEVLRSSDLTKDVVRIMAAIKVGVAIDEDLLSRRAVVLPLGEVLSQQPEFVRWGGHIDFCAVLGATQVHVVDSNTDCDFGL